MVLCEIGSHFGLITTWLIIWVALSVLVLAMSGYLFTWLYVNTTYETWVHKSNPKFPPLKKVRDEITQTIGKSALAGAFCPALGLYLSSHGYAQAYCGWAGWQTEARNFMTIWILTDFWEFFYHWCGHYFDKAWTVHRHHHVFYNPTPFAVIADEYMDQIWRTLPLVVFPMIWPINMDLMLLQFAVFFYAYGLVLHSGFEFEHIVDAHHPIWNTAFQHYYHHARSTKNKPYHCGFFLKIWDQKFGSVYADEGDPLKCLCVKCCRERGERSRELYDKIEKPDYTPLYTVGYWKDSLMGKCPEATSKAA